MEGKDFMVVAAISLIVAVVASIATMNITGETIKVTPSINGTEIYTKQEIFTVMTNLLSKYEPKGERYLLGLTGWTKSDGVNYTDVINLITGGRVCDDVTNGDRCIIGNVVLTANKVDEKDKSAKFTISSLKANTTANAYKVNTRDPFLINKSRDEYAFIAQIN